jgi:hypothetical protein
MVDVNISVGTVRAGHDLTWVLIIIIMSKSRLRTNNSTESEGRAAGGNITSIPSYSLSFADPGREGV